MEIQRLRLRTATDVRRFLQRVAVAAINGELDPKVGNMIVSLCNAVLNSIRIDEQEKKLDELERIIEEKSKGNRW